MFTSVVENYPGFPDGIAGPELMSRMRKQAERFGTRIVDEDATAVDFSRRPFVVTVGEKSYEAECVIIATGASPRKMEVPGEQRLMGRGVSYCAVCDGAFFREKELAVVGGGDTAMEEALFLTKYASKVTVIHRRSELRASAIMQERAKSNPKIAFIWDTVVDEVLGENKVEGLRLRNVKTGQQSVFRCDGVFVAIGLKPNSELFAGKVELDEKGYAKRFGNSRTSVEGVFVAGDVFDHRYRQAVTAAGDGCAAAIDAERWLSGLK